MKKTPRIALFGNQWITGFLLGKLLKNGIAPTVIVNLPQSFSSRISGYQDLANLEEASGIETLRPFSYSLTDGRDREALSALEIDLLIAFGWQRLIPEWLLEVPRLGAWGVHGSPEQCPRGRGRAVFNWSIILGYDHFNLYLFKLLPDPDSGPIFATREFSITERDDALTVYHKNALLSSEMILDLIGTLSDEKSVRLTEQPTENATYLPARSPDNGGIDWTAGVEEIDRLIRGVVSPYPGAFSVLNGERVEIRTAQPFDLVRAHHGRPGEIIELFPNGHFIVGAGQGSLYVRDYLPKSSSIKVGERFDEKSGTRLPLPRI